MSRSTLPLLALLLCPAAATAQAVRLDVSNLNLGRDSFAIQAQGRVIGFQRTEFSRTDSGFVFREETQVGTMMSQSTTVSLDPRMATRSVAQSGKSQGKDNRINIAYANSRVKGEALVAGQPDSRQFTIDTTVAPSTIDDNAVQPVLSALHWSDTANYSLTLFSAGKNALESATLTVKDTATVTVPAGAFLTFRVELMSGVGPGVNFFLTTEAPHRVVKITVNGTPLEFVLVKEE